MNYDVQNFTTDVLNRSYQTPVLVDFWAEWCGPCRMLSPILERLANKYKHDWVLAKVNTEQFPELAQQYGIQGIPTVKLFVDGQVAGEFVGALPEPQIEQWLQKVLPSKQREHIKKAQELLFEGNTAKARKILQQVLQAEPDNAQAAVFLAETYLKDDPQQAQDLVQHVTAASEYFPLAEGIRTFAGLFLAFDQPETLPDAPVKATYLQAIQHTRATEYEAALQAFLKVVRQNRAYHDDGARKACLAIFQFLGNDHDLTRTYRSELSSALYA